ncbi:MAG: type I-C CRISPR-associated protein Cas8c/Csd1 [Spirochaetes bacterium]|jgi:CRISPR-associated protein Csd1|nr:type I-C CRISPR-associated protein Cas8c/Csd1 [Spirochaetota bacterium]
MIKELCDLGQTLRDQKTILKDDALDEIRIGIDLVIDNDSKFIDFILLPDEKMSTKVELLTSKKGKARLLVDKVEEILGYNNNQKKHDLYIEKLNQYNDIQEIQTVLKFIKSKSEKNKAIRNFDKIIPEKQRKNNVAIRIDGDKNRINEKIPVIKSIIEKYNNKNIELNNHKLCSICGFSKYPVIDIPHGMISRVPDGQSSGCALISYNENAYESYLLSGNDNSSVCTHCARLYTQGFNWLLTSGDLISDGKKRKIIYSNRKNLGKDTAIVYWLKSNKPVQEIDYIEHPEDVDILDLINDNIDYKKDAQLSDVNQTLSSPAKGKKHISENMQTDFFYSITLSGAAARIAVRDWMSLTLEQLKSNIAHYFKDIGIINYSKTSSSVIYPSINKLAWACAVHKKTEKNGTVMYGIDFDDVSISRTGALLWKTALQGNIPPINILDKVLRRIKTEGGRIDASSASLIKLLINRNNKGGQKNMKEQLDKENKSTAYLTGRVFAVMESIQRAALGDSVNAGIRERFFASASTTPATAFGRLFRMCQQHLTKLKGEKKGLVIYFDKQLGELMSKIDILPTMFSLEEQGQFAVGYYHQKQDIFMQAQKNKELKDAIETDVENEAGGKK